MDGHMSLFGSLEPVDYLFYRRQLCIEGSLLAFNVAGTLSDGGAFALVVRRDNPT
jgi:hypothetical protein